MRDAIINSWPNSIQLETYRKDEVLALSVKELTEEELFYNASRTEDKIPQSGGLYDPCMGPMNRGKDFNPNMFNIFFSIFGFFII